MIQDKLTNKSQEVIVESQNYAQQNQNQLIENGHLLHAILEIDSTIILFFSEKLQFNPQDISTELEQIIQTYPKVTGGSVQFSNAANKTFVNAISLAKKWKTNTCL